MDSKDYIDLRLEQLKLKGADTASEALGSALSWVLIIAVALLALTVLAFGGILLLGKLLGDYALGALIVAGVLLLALLLLYLLRKKLFRGSFIKMLSGQPNQRELQRAEELNAVRLEAAQENISSGFSGIGLRVARILLRLLTRK